jgi:hypothetical protein
MKVEFRTKVEGKRITVERVMNLLTLKYVMCTTP